MRVLIRFLSRTPAGAVEQRDRSFEGDVLTIGRATDQVLHLKDRRVGLQHARITRRGSNAVLTCVTLGGATVNGSPVRESRLAVGDTVQIGANILKLIAAPAGFDLAFTFELDPAAAAEAITRERPVTRLADTGLSKRRWSWALFVVVLATTLLLPAASLQKTALRDGLRSSPLPSDRAWTSGPLHAVHTTIAGKCEACHVSAFVPVADAACLECHRGTATAHMPDPGLLPASLGERHCTDCHREHKQPAMLVRGDDALCSACHATLAEQLGADAPVHDVADFAVTHPGFRVSLLQTDDSGNTRVQRVPLSDPALRERSRLSFSHAVHLDSRGVEAPTGRQVMGCGDCHRPEPGGARMQPIQMERDCANCHRLSFDPADPGRQVPHGPADQVQRSLAEYYSARYLQDSPDPYAVTRPDRSPLRPLPELTPAEREAVLQRARDQAARAARDLFERRTCDTCHEVERLPNEAGWRVTPVRLTQQWLPRAGFNHAKHGTSLTACTDCHAAGTSKRSSDVLMPDITVCRDCHGGGATTESRGDRVISGCALCHSYHPADGEPWPLAAGTTTARVSP